MLIMPSFQKSLIVEQFQGNYLNTKLEFKYKGLLAKSDVCHRCLCVISDQTEMAKEKEY